MSIDIRKPITDYAWRDESPPECPVPEMGLPSGWRLPREHTHDCEWDIPDYEERLEAVLRKLREVADE